MRLGAAPPRIRTLPLLVLATLSLFAVLAWSARAAGQEVERGPHRVTVPMVAADAPPRPQVIGTSVEGRPIEAYTIGRGERTIALLGGLHTGAEAETVTVARALLDHYAGTPGAVPEGVRLVVVPLVNPDGFAAGTRTNARNVDLNRNFPTDDWRPDAQGPLGDVSGGDAPLSEPEARALYDFLRAVGADLVIEWHGYGGLVEANEVPLGDLLGRHYARAAEFDYLEEWVAYPITGELAVAMEELGIPAFDVELELGDPEAAARHRRAVDAMVDALARGEWAQAAGDGCTPVRAAPGGGAAELACLEAGSVLWSTGTSAGEATGMVRVILRDGRPGWAAVDRLEASGPPEPETTPGDEGSPTPEQDATPEAQAATPVPGR